MKSYVVMADNREKIICVSDDLRLARGAGWDWLKKQYNPDNWQDILEDMDYESENDLRHDMLLGACWMKICGGRFVATMQREIFKRFAPFGAFLFVFFRGRTAQDGRGPIFSGSAVSTKYVRKCCAI